MVEVTAQIASDYSVLSVGNYTINVYSTLGNEPAPFPVEKIAQFFMQSLCPNCKLLKNFECTGMKKSGSADVLYVKQEVNEVVANLSNCQPANISI